jgi:L-Ala-D/L-Glu epimerase
MHQNQTHIACIEVFPLNIALKYPFVISRETITHAENVLVRITAANGQIGYGECSPYRSIAGESQATCLAVAPLLAQALMGKNPLEIDAAVQAMDRAIVGQRCIKSAFDLALFDLVSRVLGLPLYQYLGGDNKKILRTDMTVGISTPEKMAAQALAFKNEGFYAIKIKLGTNVADDLARVKAIRSAVGPDLPLRVDANQGWSLNVAAQTLKAIAQYDIEYCEEPISKNAYTDLPHLRAQSLIPIMADESVFDHFDALRLIKLGACDFLNIKLSKAGGIHHARKIAQLAEAADMRCQIGCFSESRVGISAFAHFALAFPSVQRFDLDSPYMLADDPVKGGVALLPDGQVKVDEAAGIGVFFEEEYLDSIAGRLVFDANLSA